MSAWTLGLFKFTCVLWFPRDIEWETFWISTHCPTYSSIDINISLASQIKFGSTFVWKVFVCVSANLKLPSTRLWFNNCVALCAWVRVCFVMNATGDWQLFKYYLLKPARSLFCFVITLSIAHIERKQTNQKRQQCKCFTFWETMPSRLLFTTRVNMDNC